jgi:putative hemolysin
MHILTKGRYRARLAKTPNDVLRAQTLRYRSFLGPRGIAGIEARDADEFDGLCDHMLVEDVVSGDLVCCYRLQAFAPKDTLETGYAAQAYGLEAIQGFPGAKLELGRFCVAPGIANPDVLPLLQAAIGTNTRMPWHCCDTIWHLRRGTQGKRLPRSLPTHRSKTP